jgi:hypothetical protein
MPNLTEPLNITEIVGVYTAALLNLFANLYYGNVAGIYFYPAYPITLTYFMSSTEYSTLSITNTTNDASLQTLYFRPTGESYNSSAAYYPNVNLTELNELLGLSEQTSQNFWIALNWIFNVWFWIAIYDFGQVSFPLTGFPGNPWDTNSIFTNNTLLESFTSITNEVIVPGTPIFSTTNSSLDAHPLSETNRLEPVLTPLLESYTCTQRKLKGWLSVVISVIVADYALTLGAYNLFILIAGWWQKRKDNAGEPQVLYW